MCYGICMTTMQIIMSQLRHMNLNRNNYLLICIPCFVLSIIVEYEAYIILSGLIYLALYYLVAVNVHRLVILDEDKNYFSLGKRLRPTFSYFCYSLLIIIFSWGGWLMLAIYLFFAIDLLASSILLFVVMGILIIFSVFCTIIVYPSLALNLPIASIGEKVQFFKMWKLSKGFKLTIFLQFIIIFLSYIIISLPFIWIFEWGFFSNVIISFFSVFSVALTVSCLSKTYLLWKEKNI